MCTTSVLIQLLECSWESATKIERTIVAVETHGSKEKSQKQIISLLLLPSFLCFIRTALLSLQISSDPPIQKQRRQLGKAQLRTEYHVGDPANGVRTGNSSRCAALDSSAEAILSRRRDEETAPLASEKRPGRVSGQPQYIARCLGSTQGTKRNAGRIRDLR